MADRDAEGNYKALLALLEKSKLESPDFGKKFAAKDFNILFDPNNPQFGDYYALEDGDKDAVRQAC